MALLPRLSDVLADNPIHKAVVNMRQAVSTARGDIQSLASALRMETTTYVAPKASTPVPYKVEPASVEVPTEEETTIELKKRLLEEIASAEDDLVHKLKINGKACSCLDGKHDLKIISKSRELMPKEPNNPLYGQIINWWESNHDKLTARASASGKYDEEYLKMAGQQGNFRRQLQKELMGSGQDSPNCTS